MGWADYHLHRFRIQNLQTGQLDEIGIPNEDRFEDEFTRLASWGVPISGYFKQAGTQAEYEYDFGDCWMHEVVLEEIVSRIPKKKYPVCIEGARAILLKTVAVSLDMKTC